MFSGKEFIKTVVIVWIIGSIIYIGFDIWNDYKIKGIQQAYQSGVTDSIKQIFDKSQASQCKQPVEITLGDNKMEIVDVNCLKQAQRQAEQLPGKAGKP